jgi:Fur family ferric uptake transcriptional regulator
MERTTRQREAIWRVLKRADRPLGPREIFECAQREVPRLGMATVYRNVKAMVEEERLRVVELPGAPDRYEVGGKEHHHHFLCRRCDGLFEVEFCVGGFEHITPEGFTLENHEVTLYGLCEGCSDPPRASRDLRGCAQP